MTSYTHRTWSHMMIKARLKEIGYSPREPQDIYIPEEILDQVIGPISDLLKYTTFDVHTIRESSYFVCTYFSKKLQKEIVISKSVDIYEYSSIEDIADKISLLELEAKTMEDKIAINSWVKRSTQHGHQLKED